MASSGTSTRLVWMADGGWCSGNAARPPLSSAGFGASLGRVEFTGSPCLLSGILQQPWTKGSRTNYAPQAQPRHTQSPPPDVLPSPVCSHKICPAHSQALRPAEGINPMVPCAPAWGSSQALGSCQVPRGKLPVLALPNPHPPILWWVRRLGVSRGRAEFTHGRTQGCCPHGAPLEQCR